MVLLKSAPAPIAVLSTPSPVDWFPTLKRSVPAPTPVLKLPSVLLHSENQPTAVFATPVVRLKRAFCPSAVLNPGYPPSGAGTTASAFDKSPKQASAPAMRSGRIVGLH